MISFISRDKDIKIDMASLDEILAILKDYGNTPISSLPTMADNLLRTLETMIGMAKDDPAAYETIINRIKESFDGTKTKIIPNTVNAYLLGCMYDQDFTGPLGCSPKCINGIVPMDGSVDVSPCSDMVIIYDGHLQIKNAENSGHAWIYVGPQFTGFNENDLMILRTHGVKTASMIYGMEDGKYRDIRTPVPISNLPTVRAVPTDVPLTPNTMENPGSSNWWWIVLIIVIIIVLLIIGYFWIDRRRRAALPVVATYGGAPTYSSPIDRNDNYMLKTPNGKIYTLTEDFQ